MWPPSTPSSSIASTLLHVLFTSRLLKTFGLKIALFVSPVILGLGAAAGWLVPAGSLLLWATLLRGTDKSLSHSPEPIHARDPVYPRPDRDPVQGQGLHRSLRQQVRRRPGRPLPLPGLSRFFGLPVRTLSALTLAFLFAWAVFNRRILIEYVGIIKKNLMISRPDADQLVLDQIDVNSTKLVFDTLESRNRSSVLYAMNLLDLVRKDKLTPGAAGDHRRPVLRGPGRVVRRPARRPGRDARPGMGRRPRRRGPRTRRSRRSSRSTSTRRSCAITSRKSRKSGARRRTRSPRWRSPRPWA